MHIGQRDSDDELELVRDIDLEAGCENLSLLSNFEYIFVVIEYCRRIYMVDRGIDILNGMNIP